jgi:alanyl-tRNA synthetase
MTSHDIRDSFLGFFRRRAHTIVPSAPVIPAEDPTLLFTNAGMNQFKDVFLGTGKRPYVRAADSQKCIRVSGKHNDLEEVGRDTYHHTFFEMLGNWSFGDYYKAEAIGWAWELLTREWGLDPARLYATVFETDDEAEAIWRTMPGMDPRRILRFGKKDNFWEMGETGPCGPCSEIHVDLTPDGSGGALVNAGDPRVMEIWNLVFIQYNRNEEGALTPLPATHVDTGMGFERICAVLQNKRSNYDTDVFMPIIGGIAELSGRAYGGTADGPFDVAMRVIADHARMLTFAIADGGMPSNEGRGYVIRRILRRASRFGRNLGMHEPFLHRVVPMVAEVLGGQYPELAARREHCERIIRGEEESFNVTLDRGLEIFGSVAGRLGAGREFPAGEAFKLYDTYGFPFDLTRLIASEQGLTIDEAKFTELMGRQKEQSRRSGKEKGRPQEGGLLHSGETARKIEHPAGAAKTDFTGYVMLEGSAPIVAVDRNAVVVAATPFYAESGGQVGDTGRLEGGGRAYGVTDTQRSGDLIVHVLDALCEYRPGDTIQMRVDGPRRAGIAANHTATHLVHESLRRVLGSGLQQQGSLVAPDRLRFDFNHHERISPDQLRAIEEMVNEKIALKVPVHALNDPKEWLTIEEAKRRYPNVKMFFGEKYGHRVRIVEIDPSFSVELCGGTHTPDTAELGCFKIVSESGISSGVRRIEAVTGDGFRAYLESIVADAGALDRQIEQLLRDYDALVRQLGGAAAPPAGAAPAPLAAAGVSIAAVARVEEGRRERHGAIDRISRDIASLRKEVGRKMVDTAASGLDAILSKGVPCDGFKVVAERVEAPDMDALKNLGDRLRDRLGSGVGVLGTVLGDKVALVCVVTDDLVSGRKLSAGRIVGAVARIAGGGGGGKDHLATAGGKDPAKLDEALAAVPGVVSSMITGAAG